MQDTDEQRRGWKTGWIVVAVLLFFLVAVAIYKNVSATGATKPVATSAEGQTGLLPAPAVRAEPTEDYPAQIADDNERVKIAEQGRYDAQLAAIQAQQEAVNAKAAQVAAEVALKQIALEREKVALDLQNAKVKEAETAIELRKQNNQAAQLRIEQDKVNAEKTPAAIQNTFMAAKAEQDIKYSEKKAQADIFFKTALPVVIGLLALTLLGWLIWTFLYARYIASQPAAEPDEQPAPAQPIISIHEHKDGGETILRKQPPPCDDDTFQEWAEKMLTGDSAAINAWETADSPFSRKNYPAKYYRRVFWTWITENGIVENDPKDGRLVLSARGREVCEVWKIQHPHSPADEISPKSASTPAMSMGSMPMAAEGRGVPPMSEPFPGMKGQS